MNQILAALKGSALEEMLTQISAFGEGRYYEEIPRYIESLREQRRELTPGSVPWDESMSLEAFLGGLARFERRSLLGEQRQDVLHAAIAA